MRIPGCLVLVGLATGCATTPKIWHRFETEHVILNADTSKQRGEALIRHVEKFRTALGVLTGLDFSEDATPKLRVYAFSDHGDYVAASERPGTGGIYRTHYKGNVSLISVDDDAGRDYGRQVLLHEYTHHLLHQYSPFTYPRWYDEGFAEYVSTIQFEGHLANIGRPPMERLIALKATGSWLTLDQLIGSKGKYIGYMGHGTQRDPDRYRVGLYHQYAQGWLTVHFLHNTKRYAKGLSAYLNAVSASDVDEKKAFREAFGVSHEDMQAEIYNYWYARKLPISIYNLKGRLTDAAVQYRQLSPAEGRVVAVETKAKLARLDAGDADEALQQLSAALKNLSDPAAQAHTLKVMAEIAMVGKQWERAAALIDDLASRPEGEADAYALRAQRLFAMKEKDALTAEDTQQIIEWCTQALERNPRLVPAVHDRVRAALLPHGDVTPTILKLVAYLRTLAPGVGSVDRMEVSVLSKLGEHDQALEKVDRLIEWATSQGAARSLKKLRAKVLAAKNKPQT